MYLSKLELFGFKSFAQRVQVKFDSGLTAIVGPNGCGKTNIVDAIRWVLGEQKTSVLRSEKMENVIFSGTKSRRALGMAEITLTIENTKNILPTAYTEVSITRRLYRSGDSEYFLNKVPCRLKDIHDLFVDTGMGSDAYSVIELKMIEQILSDNTEDRRKLFEEAAGITKYKYRRRQTLKTLESTHLDLDRVKDIVAEVQKNVNTLERQAKKATQAKTLKNELYDLEIAYSEEQLKNYKSKLDPLKTSLPEYEKNKAELDTEITTLRANHEELQLNLVNKEKALNESQKELNAKTEIITKSEKHLLSNQERLKSLETTKVKAHEAIQGIDQKKVELQEEQQEFKLELSQAQEAFLAQKQAFESQKEKHVASEQELKNLRSEIDEKTGHIQSVSKELSEIRVNTQNYETKIESFERSIERSQEQLESRKQDIEKKKQVIEELNKRHSEANTKFLGEQNTYEGLISKRSGLQEEIEDQKESLLLKRSELNKLQNRTAFLASLLENYEDLPEGIAHLEKKPDEKFGIGILSDLFSTNEEYKKAISAALGEHLSYYVTQSKKNALHAIAELKEADKGKVTFILLDHFSQSVSLFSQNTLAIPNAKWAMDTIKTSPDIQPLLQTLLDRTYIVDTLQEAETLSEEYPDYIFACKTGEKLSNSGFVRGGGLKENEGDRIGRKEEQEQLKKKLLELQKTIAHEEHLLQTKEESLRSIDLKSQEHVVKSSQLDLTTIEKQQSRFNFEIETNEKEIERAIALVQSESEQKSELELTLSELQPKLEQLERELKIEEENQLAFKSSISEKEAAHKMLTEALQEQNLQLRDAEHRIDTLQNKLQRNQDDFTSAEREQNKLQEEISTADEEIFRNKSEIETINENLKLLYQEKDSAQKSIAELEFEYNALKGDFNINEKKLRELQSSRDTQSEIIHQYKQDISKLEYQIENLKTLIFQEYDFDLETIQFQPNPDLSLEDADERIANLKRRLKNLGAVNELALEEFETEKQRLEFLMNQRQDLMDSEKQLRDTIAEINKTAHEKFMTTFTQIRQNFIDIFRDLFHEGDQADLILDESEDPLEANIDIIAKPKGKRPQAITLLSGGEKTLTAISLLFAIYLVKPSPFCILDEVDAPLDDANIDRFIALIQKFAENTQFIVVTHNKRTMECSRVLYGVTMEEEGISKLVAVKLGNILMESKN